MPFADGKNHGGHYYNNNGGGRRLFVAFVCFVLAIIAFVWAASNGLIPS